MDAKIKKRKLEKKKRKLAGPSQGATKTGKAKPALPKDTAPKAKPKRAVQNPNAVKKPPENRQSKPVQPTARPIQPHRFQV